MKELRIKEINGKFIIERKIKIRFGFFGRLDEWHALDENGRTICPSPPKYYSTLVEARTIANKFMNPVKIHSV